MGTYNCMACNATEFKILVDKRKVVMYIQCAICQHQEHYLSFRKLIREGGIVNGIKCSPNKGV